MTKFVKTKISNQASFLLANLNAQTHPNESFRQWVDDPNKETAKYTQELLDADLIKEINGIYSPTPAGVHYFTPKQNTQDVDELIRRIKQALPPNPKFSVVVRGLSGTALLGLIYECLGEIGYRGNPDDQDKFNYWQTKINAIQAVLKDATPDTLWEHQQNQMVAFGAPAEKTKKVKK